MKSFPKPGFYRHVDLFDLLLHQRTNPTDWVAKHETNSFSLLNEIQINKSEICLKPEIQDKNC